MTVPDRYTYEYGANGQTAEVTDNNLNRVARTEYDLADRPRQSELRDGSGNVLYRTNLKYDKLNNLKQFAERVGSEGHTSDYAYDRDNRTTEIAYDGTAHKVGYTYDALGRMATRTAESGVTAGKLTSSYSYVGGGYGTNSTTPLVAKITQGTPAGAAMDFEYEYDTRGNIILEKRGSLTTTYAYDALGQLIRVNDPHDTTSGSSGTTWVYSYDRGGNILSKARYAYTTADTLGTALQTISYTYGDSNWKDKLTAYDGVTITYDAIGNPLSDGTWTYTWGAGRQLRQMSRTGMTVQFKYDHNGLRTQKMVTENGVTTTTNYVLHGKLITHMTRGTDSLHFFYDAQSRPAKVSFNGVMYTYVHNLQGDVTGIHDNEGNLVVEYKYDAWGKPTATVSTLISEDIGELNPFRYRGYVYDKETGLYYLRSRYYSPKLSRFVNADRLIIKSKEWNRNQYIYGSNTPTNRTDVNGNEAKTILSSFLEAVVNTVKKFAQTIASFVKKSIAYVRIQKSLSSSQTFSYTIKSTDRTWMFGAYRDFSTTTLTVIPASNLEDYIFEKWMNENYVNTTPIEEGFSYAIDVLLEFLPDPVPGLGIMLGVPSSFINLVNAGDDTKLAQCIHKAKDNNSGIVIINESYVSPTTLFEKNTYYEFYDYLNGI